MFYILGSESGLAQPGLQLANLAEVDDLKLLTCLAPLSQR